MSTQSIKTFFADKTLEIPGYQRDYAWQLPNVNDLFDDIEEALEVGVAHYFGTFILCQLRKGDPVHVVDGQQRLTTLTLLVNALVSVLEDESIRQFYRTIFIEDPVSGAKFRVLGSNEAFFRELLEGGSPTPHSDGQERLLEVSGWVRHRVMALCNQGGQDLIKRWLQCISQMEVLQFIEPSEGKAIRMFQSVNDRGVPLSKMDVIKSLLVYYSNRYLEGELDAFISEEFGKAFRSFSRIKRLAGKDGYKIKQIARKDFGEDDVLRYHYLAFDGAPFDAKVTDYWLTAEGVLNNFLKPAVKSLRADIGRLRDLILAYTSDLARFFSAFEQLVESTRHDRQAYLLWVIQDLSVTLYPLVIRLHLCNWLSQSPDGDPRTLQDIVEVTDLRVFKLRGTNPQADIYTITRDLHQHDLTWVAEKLKGFCDWGMPDSMMSSRLVDEDMYRNLAVPRMLLESEERVSATLGEPELSLEGLAELSCAGLSVEHILPQDYDNSFNPVPYGFADDAEYKQYMHRLGNLALLESSINSACRNQAVEAKFSKPGLYPASSLSAIKAIAARYADNSRFDREQLLARSRILATIMVERWPIRRPQPTSD